MQMCCWQTSVQIALAASGGDLPFGQLVVPTFFRLRVGEAVARPAPRAAWEASEVWIQEMAEQDASMQEHMTANDEAPLGDAGEVGSGGDAGVVAQLQARILELESQQVQPDQGRPPRLPLQFEPPARDPVQGALFGDLPRGGAAVSPGVLKQLQKHGRPCSESVVPAGSKTQSEGRTHVGTTRSGRVGCWGAPRGGVSSFGSGGRSAPPHLSSTTSTDGSFESKTDFEVAERSHHKRPGQRRRQLELKWGSRLRGKRGISTCPRRHPRCRQSHHDECGGGPWSFGASDWQRLAGGSSLANLHGPVHGLQLADRLRPSGRAGSWPFCQRIGDDRADCLRQRPLSVRLVADGFDGARSSPNQHAQAEVGDQTVRQVGRCPLGSGQRGVSSRHRLPRDPSPIFSWCSDQSGQGEGRHRSKSLAQEETWPEQGEGGQWKHHGSLNKVAAMHDALADEPVLCSRSGRPSCSTGVNVGDKHSNEFHKDLQGFEASSDSACVSPPLPTFQETPELPFSFFKHD